MKNKMIPDARYSDEQKNSMVKACLRSPTARRTLNESLAIEISDDVYSMSLARVLFEPQILSHDGRLKHQVVSGTNSVVQVWLRESKKTIVVKNAYRDSVEEEETTTVRKTLTFVPAGAVATRVKQFPLLNNTKFRAINLNGTAYSMVDRSRQRMAWAMAHDESRLAIHCINWAADNRGKRIVTLTDGDLRTTLEYKVKKIRDQNMVPVVLANPKTAVEKFVLRYGTPNMDFRGMGKMSSPVAMFTVMDEPVAVYQHDMIPEGRIIVTPCGRGLGVIGIENHVDIGSSDKPEKSLIGWRCAEKVGFVMANPDLVVSIWTGWRGVLQAIRSCFTFWPRAPRTLQSLRESNV